MNITVGENPEEVGKSAGKRAAEIINEIIAVNGTANIILATGASQFETLNQLIKENVDWSKVTMFHLDEYINLPESHPASFRKYLRERFLNKVSPLKTFYLINGEENPEEECRRLGNLISEKPIDIALVGVGENGHLAFNDPPADFENKQPYIVVNLDSDCRQQQFKEGWFDSIDEVPRQAISMSIHQILKSKYIICSAPDSRKAIAIKNTIEGQINNLVPASILQTHMNCEIFLDHDSADLLKASL